MRIVGSIVALVAQLVLASFAQAQESRGWLDGFSVGYGQDNIDRGDIIYFGQLGVQKNFNRRWWDNDFGYLTGHFELAVNRWSRAGDQVYNLGLIPIFRYHFRRVIPELNPHIYGGLGLTYGDDTNIGNRDLSTQFLFKENLGIGFSVGQFDFSLGAVHYSNGDIKGENDGLTAFFGKISYRFP